MVIVVFNVNHRQFLPYASVVVKGNALFPFLGLHTSPLVFSAWCAESTGGRDGCNLLAKLSSVAVSGSALSSGVVGAG